MPGVVGSGPRAVLVAGPAGSGKTTLGCALAPVLGAALLDLDVLTNPLLAGLDLDAPRVRAARYESLVATACAQLEVGLPVVLVAPFSAEVGSVAVWSAVVARLQAAGAGAVELVWLDCPAPLLAERLRGRGARRDAVKVSDAGSLERFVAGLREPVVPVLRVAAGDPVAAQVAGVLRQVG